MSLFAKHKYENVFSADEMNLLTKMIESIQDVQLRLNLISFLPLYHRAYRADGWKELYFGYRRLRFFKIVALNKEIPELLEEIELAKAKIRFSDGTNANIILSGNFGGLASITSVDKRVCRLYSNSFVIHSVTNLFGNDNRNAKVQAVKKQYLRNLDIELHGWTRRSDLSLELLEVCGHEYIALAEKGEDMLFGRRGKLFLYNFISDDGELRAVTLEELILGST